jgi:flagellar biosynthesis/type III secretory pathway protein FliH
MADFTTKEEFSWTFPEVNGDAVFKPISEKEDSFESIKSELEMLKQEYLQRIIYVNNLINDLKNSSALITNDIVEIIKEIIHKITYHIIQKEINLDDTLIKKCIETLIEFLPYKNGIFTVYLAQSDVDKIEALGNQSILAKVHPEFNSGDILIKSNSAEIRALLSERINLLLKDNHA